MANTEIGQLILVEAGLWPSHLCLWFVEIKNTKLLHQIHSDADSQQAERPAVNLPFHFTKFSSSSWGSHKDLTSCFELFWPLGEPRKMPVVNGDCREISRTVSLSWWCCTVFSSPKVDGILASCVSPDIQGLAGSQGHLHALTVETPAALTTSLQLMLCYWDCAGASSVIAAATAGSYLPAVDG